MRLLRAAGIVALAAVLGSCGGLPTGPSETPAPIVSSITPSSGPAAGGTSVQIAGANFSTGATVTIGGVAAANVVVESATSISAITGAHPAGAGDVVVTSAGGTGSLPGAFTYQPESGPPSITAIAARGARPNEPASFADIGEEITVTAAVQDPDTPADQLSYEWSADGGTFSGTGASVKWRAPASLPAGTNKRTLTLTLTVSDGTRVSATAKVSVHDSIKEVGDLARLFLLDFSDSSIRSPEYVVRNFSTSDRCAEERTNELQDVRDNRERYQVLSSLIEAATVKVEFGGRPCSYPNPPLKGDACAAVPATWNSLCLIDNEECKKGDRPRSHGIDHVTAVYEQSQWKLCASKFQGLSGIRFMR